MHTLKRAGQFSKNENNELPLVNFMNHTIIMSTVITIITFIISASLTSTSLLPLKTHLGSLHKSFGSYSIRDCVIILA